MASTRPPRMYSPSARVGKRRGGSTGVAGMVEFAGSDGRSTDPVNRSAASIRRRNRPNTAFKLRGRSDMRIHPSITEPRRPDGPFFKAAVRRTISRGKLLESLGLQRQTNRHLIDERPIKPASGLESCRGRTRRRSAGPPLLGGTAVRQRGPALVQARREDLRSDCVGVNRGRWQERAEVRRHERRGRRPAAAGRRLPVARENPDDRSPAGSLLTREPSPVRPPLSTRPTVLSPAREEPTGHRVLETRAGEQGVEARQRRPGEATNPSRSPRAPSLPALPAQPQWQRPGRRVKVVVDGVPA